MTIGQCLSDRRRKGFNKPERAIVLTWNRQVLGELNHYIFFIAMFKTVKG
jgi:hypothetical protein